MKQTRFSWFWATKCKSPPFRGMLIVHCELQTLYLTFIHFQGDSSSSQRHPWALSKPSPVCSSKVKTIISSFTLFLFKSFSSHFPARAGKLQCQGSTGQKWKREKLIYLWLLQELQWYQWVYQSRIRKEYFHLHFKLQKSEYESAYQNQQNHKKWCVRLSEPINHFLPSNILPINKILCLALVASIVWLLYGISSPLLKQLWMSQISEHIKYSCHLKALRNSRFFTYFPLSMWKVPVSIWNK